MNAIQIIALIVSAASIVAGLVAAGYLLVWLSRHGAPMLNGEWPQSLKRPLIAATAILAVPVVRGLCAMVLVWQEGLK
jgi:hypothetical protein